MAYISYDRALHAAPVVRPAYRIAWARLFLLGATAAFWVGVIAAARAIF